MVFQATAVPPETVDVLRSQRLGLCGGLRAPGGSAAEGGAETGRGAGRYGGRAGGLG